VSNASKWTVRQIPHRFEWLLVDEAYQIPEYRFRRLAPLAKRYVLVGDPGQIDPIIQSDVSPWGCDPDGPQVPCPTAAIHRQGLEPQNLPVSWRLPRETSALVRDAFYDFDFSSGDPEGRRSLRLGSGSAERIDETLDVLQGPGNSIAAAVLNGDKVGTDVDPELAEFVAAAVARMLDRGVTVTDENGFSSSLSPADIGVVTAHRAQVAEIDKRLRSRGVATGEGAVVVETTERWQGLERHVMIVHHPLAGLDSLSSFDLDRGRLCVMLSRHKTSCLIVAREGIEETLRNHPHEGQRFAGGRDEEYRGWVANRLVWARLREAGAMVEAN
jgi:hypothetical protein